MTWESVQAGENEFQIGSFKINYWINRQAVGMPGASPQDFIVMREIDRNDGTLLLFAIDLFSDTELASWNARVLRNIFIRMPIIYERILNRSPSEVLQLLQVTLGLGAESFLPAANILLIHVDPREHSVCYYRCGDFPEMCLNDSAQEWCHWQSPVRPRYGMYGEAQEIMVNDIRPKNIFPHFSILLLGVNHAIYQAESGASKNENSFFRVLRVLTTFFTPPKPITPIIRVLNGPPILVNDDAIMQEFLRRRAGTAESHPCGLFIVAHTKN